MNIYNDNGVTVYSFINKLTGDPGSSPQTRGPLRPGESEYHNDTQNDGDSIAYAWKRNTAGTWDNNFEGGQSSRKL